MPSESEKRVCRICGCDEELSCTTVNGACFWVEWDLCSSCFNLAYGQEARI